MKILEKKDDKIVFTAEIEESLANALRRYLNRLDVLAIDEVEISKNDSPLYDETIAHRLGLIPLKMDKTINEKTVAKLKLNSEKGGTIYSGDFNGPVKVVYDKIPITSLDKGRELELVATAKIGKGTEHSKFSPGLMFYRNVFEIKIDKDCPKEVVKTCPQKILKLDEGKIVVEDNYKCDLCEACIEFCKKEKKDAIKINPTNELIISVESFGQFKVEEILKKVTEELKKDLKEVSKKVDKS